MKKILLAMVAMMLLVTPAMAGNQPEFDAVGCDATNFFNDFIKVAVCENGTLLTQQGLIRINEYSNWPLVLDAENNPVYPWYEYFRTTAGLLLPDHCFDALCTEGYSSALIDPWNEAIYEWQIVLQKKPESDLDLNIRDCVVKHNTFDIWTNAEQTGRYRAPWGELVFIPSANPSITVMAYPGPFATPGFNAPFVMDARTMPLLTPVALSQALYTTKALWEESLVMKLPATGQVNTLGQATYNLHQGDYVNIVITIPPNNTVDLRYGPDNVTIKYIGIVGMETVNLADPACGICEGCL